MLTVKSGIVKRDSFIRIGVVFYDKAHEIVNKLWLNCRATADTEVTKALCFIMFLCLRGKPIIYCITH
jgi:hypothetical protein